MEYNDFEELGMLWGENYITLADIADGIVRGVEEQTEQYQPPALTGDHKWDDWHIGRVIYFINNPDRITPISVDNYCLDNMFSNAPIIEDGHHRLMAVLYLKRPTIEAAYSGRIDILEYLTGASNEKPDEWI